MAADCCFIAYTLCTPAGAPVIGFLNAETQVYETYLNADGTPFTGDTGTLGACAGAGGGSTSALTQVDNGDGTITVTHDPGDGSAAVSFTACASCTTAVDNSDGTATITNPDGSTVTVCASCTAVVDNGDGTYTATNPDGSTVTWATGGGGGATSSLTDNGDGTWTHDDGTGTTVTITSGNVADNGDGTATVTFPDGSTATVCVDCETVTTLVDNGDGTYDYTSEDGTVTTVTGGTVADNGDGTGTVTFPDGTSATFCSDCETVTTFVDNGDGTYTYTSEDGTVTTTATPGAETVTTLVDNSDGTWTYTSENGTVTTVSSGGVIDNGDGTATVTFPDGSTATVCTDCDHASAALNGVGGVTITNPDGTTVIVPPESVTTFVDNGDGTYTYTSEDGTVTTTATPGAETVTTLVDNGDGTFTYTSENGTVTTFNAGGNTSSVTLNGDGTVTHDDGTGTTAVIDVCALVVEGGCLPTVTPGPGTAEYTFDDGHGNTSVINVNELDADISNVTLTGSVMTFTAEDGTTITVDICAVVAANCNATLTVNADGSMVHTANDGTVTNVPAPAVSQLVLNADGSFTHTAGTVVTTISICDLAGDLPSTGSPIPDDGSVQILGSDCEWHGIPGHTEVYVEGDTLTYPVTLPDGTVLAAGTPVPVGVLIVAEENADGTLIDATAFAKDECCLVSHLACDGNGDELIVAINTAVTPPVTTYYDLNGVVIATPVAPIGTCAGGATSSLVDGVNEFTHDDGEGTVVTVPQADVVVTDAYTGTVTDSEGDVIPVISQLDKCDGVPLDPATEQIIAQPDLATMFVDEEGDIYSQPSPCEVTIDEVSTQAVAPTYGSADPTVTRDAIIHDLGDDCRRHLYVSGTDDAMYPVDVPQAESIALGISTDLIATYPTFTNFNYDTTIHSRVSPNDPYIQQEAFTNATGPGVRVIVLKDTHLTAVANFVPRGENSGGITDMIGASFRLIVAGGAGTFNGHQTAVFDPDEGPGDITATAQELPAAANISWNGFAPAGTQIFARIAIRSRTGALAPVHGNPVLNYMVVTRISDTHL